MGWADWPARLQQLAPGRSSGRAKSGSTAATIPRPRARSRASRSTASTTASRCTSSSPASRPRTRAGMLEPFKGIAARRSYRADPRPCLLRARATCRDRRRARLSRPTRTTSVEEALGAIPQRRARADLRLALSRRRRARRERAGARLARWRLYALRRPSAPSRRCSRRPLALAAHAPPFEEHEQRPRAAPAAAVQRNTSA